MPFVAVQKNKAYFKRYEVKFRRRRMGRTDYRARKRLITQDKNKYNSPKYRLCVRFSNTKVTCQIIYAQLEGDKVLCAAYSDELPRYGLTVGLKNYAAAYCTGLLCARRLLNKLGLDEAYVGAVDDEGNHEVPEDVPSCQNEDTGRFYYVTELDEEKKPFKALLDVGIKATTTGARVFGALKGASDGGLDIPHSEKRFPGYDRDAKAFEAETHTAHIYGEHISDYMTELIEDDQEKYGKVFAKYIAAGIEPDSMHEMYENVHNAIRADPTFQARERNIPANAKDFRKTPKLTYEERKAKIQARKDAWEADQGAEEEEEEEGEAEAEADADY